MSKLVQRACGGIKGLTFRMMSIVAIISICCQAGNAQTADELLTRGREAFMDYRFSEAAKLYGQAKAKAKKSDEFFADKQEKYSRQLRQAQSYLERVEQIEVIDSIAVPRSEFFKAYRIPASAGRLGGHEAVPRQWRDETDADYVFTSERGNYKIWAQPSDSTDYKILVESTLLTDGTWSDPTALDEDLCEEGDAAYPFMMSDGVTLYYADNGENSIGGYDIMVATRDPSDGSFMQPSNLGFPYNSPYDDYLLAIDELNGVGWWATDRNRLEDMVTVYVFIPNDLRKNYPADEENIVELARISDYFLTQPEDADYDKLLDTIAAIEPGVAEQENDFILRAQKGKTYYRYDQLPSAQARTAVKRYMTFLKELSGDEKRLESMRKEYHRKHSQETGRRISSFEKEVEKKRAESDTLRSEMYKVLN